MPLISDDFREPLILIHLRGADRPHRELHRSVVPGITRRCKLRDCDRKNGNCRQAQNMTLRDHDVIPANDGYLITSLAAQSVISRRVRLKAALVWSDNNAWPHVAYRFWIWVLPLRHRKAISVGSFDVS
jgi:hypothetical protein